MTSLRRDQPVPLYYQIEVALRRAIEGGRLSNGRLPTEEELVGQYQVSRMTVRAALRRLEEDGLIERHRARGTFVRADAMAKIVRHPARLWGFEDDLRRQGAAAEVEVLSIEEVEPPLSVAQALSLPAGDRSYRVRRRGQVNRQPLWLESHYYPRDVGAKIVERDLRGTTITILLQEVLGVPVVAASVRVEAGAANAQQARHLGIHIGHPLLMSQFAFYDASGRTLEVLRAAFRGDRYAYSFDLLPRLTSGPAPWDPNPSQDGRDWPGFTGQLHSQPTEALTPPDGDR
jgi:GntR family transcriptional regulator